MLKVKISDTPSKLEQGLMFVEDMPNDEGMLFVFPRPMKLSFWGKNTLIPLDVAFIDKTSTITQIGNIKPYSLDAIRSKTDCLFAIEANAGYFKDNSIQVGTKVKFERYKDAYGLGLVRFAHNIEGNPVTTENNKTNKQAQLVDVNADPNMPNVPKVEKSDQHSIGDPIGNQPTPEQTDPQNLPVITPQDLGKYLEDSHDQDVQMDGQNPSGVEEFESQLGDLPPEEEVPQELPSEAPPTEEPQEQPSEEKEYPQFNTAYEAMDWATQNNEVVRISYTSKKGHQVVRDVEPHGQFHSESTHRQILVTFDETVGDIRAFIIHNIAKWAFVGRQFSKKFIVRG